MCLHVITTMKFIHRQNGVVANLPSDQRNAPAALPRKQPRYQFEQAEYHGS